MFGEFVTFSSVENEYQFTDFQLGEWKWTPSYLKVSNPAITVKSPTLFLSSKRVKLGFVRNSVNSIRKFSNSIDSEVHFLFEEFEKRIRNSLDSTLPLVDAGKL